MTKINITNFLKLNNLRKLNKEYADHVQNPSNWKSDRKHIKVTYSHFAPVHATGYGLNGNTSLVEFQESILEAKEIYFDRPFDAKSNFVRIYLTTTGKNSNSIHNGVFIELRDPKNRKIVLESPDVARLQNLFGKPFEQKKKKVAQVISNSNLKLVDDINDDRDDEEGETRAEYMERVEWFYQDLLRNIDYDISEFKDYVESKGYKFVRRFKFNQSFSISSVDFIKQNKNSIELGWMTNSTYCSHPNTLKIEKVKEVKMINLNKIGVEESGYYDHHVNLYIRPEQEEQVLKFHKRFQRNKKQK